MTERRTFYPPIEPYESGHIDVGDGHRIYYERCGTKGAKPVVFLHGGPGGGFGPDHRRQFDPALYDITLFEQRGCGRSTPFASLEDNTTWHLVGDIEKLREHCGHERWQVFGGSWGSTLSLAYAQTHPDRVSELVLRGIFLGSEREEKWLYHYGASELYPEEYERFLAPLPPEGRKNPIASFREILTGDDERLKVAAAKAWSRWESVTVTLLPNEEVMSSFTEDAHAVAVARIENHYFINHCWLEKDQLLRGVDKIRHIPTIIVQGRHDCCTPPYAAWELKKAWPEAELHIVPDGGHLFNEPGILDGLIRATDAFAGKGH